MEGGTRAIFAALSDKQVQCVAGNSMHLAAIGSVLLFCLGCSQKPCAAAGTGHR